MIAQEVEAQFPELVTSQGVESYKSVDYGKLSAVLVEAIKELKDDQDAQIGTLQTENKNLKIQMGSLEKILAESGQGEPQAHPSRLEYFLIISNLVLAFGMVAVILFVIKQRYALHRR